MIERILPGCLYAVRFGRIAARVPRGIGTIDAYLLNLCTNVLIISLLARNAVCVVADCIRTRLIHLILDQICPASMPDR